MMLKISNFVKMVPETARRELPPALRKFKIFTMPWLSQVYYDDKAAHYELVKLPSKYGDNMLEIGLHFEHREQARNAALLTGFDHYLFEIREALGEAWWAERWDRGWTKVYTTFSYQTLDEAFVEQSAHILAQAIVTMQPIYRLVTQHSG